MSAAVDADVAIVGAGPAGAALAAALAPLWNVVLVDREPVPVPRVGESLIPAAGPVLRDLGLLADLHALGFASYVGNHAWWNGKTETTDFLADPHGPGWHVDRARFESDLRGVAQTRGAHCLFGGNCRITPEANNDVGLQYQYQNGEPIRIKAQIYVDATGRRSTIARAMGARRLALDEQVARWSSWTVYNHEAPESSVVPAGFTHIASEPSGWWYHAQVPQPCSSTTMVLARHSDHDDRSRATADELRCMAMGVPGLNTLMRSTQPLNPSKAITVAANSARLDRYTGPNWLAIGDAALSFDPIASRGLFNAFYSALTAASVIDATLQSGVSCLDDYASDLNRVWAAYLAHRSWIYQSEQRWTNHPYWIKRQEPA